MPPHVTPFIPEWTFDPAIEAYVSTAANSFTDPYAVEAIRLVFTYLEIAWRSPDDLNARMHMHNPSALAGIAFTNASLGLVHSMAPDWRRVWYYPRSGKRDYAALYHSI